MRYGEFTILTDYSFYGKNDEIKISNNLSTEWLNVIYNIEDNTNTNINLLEIEYINVIEDNEVIIKNYNYDPVNYDYSLFDDDIMFNFSNELYGLSGQNSEITGSTENI